MVSIMQGPDDYLDEAVLELEPGDHGSPAVVSSQL